MQQEGPLSAPGLNEDQLLFLKTEGSVCIEGGGWNAWHLHGNPASSLWWPCVHLLFLRGSPGWLGTCNDLALASQVLGLLGGTPTPVL